MPYHDNDKLPVLAEGGGPMEQKKTSRHLYLDAARCFAVLMVALNHAVNRTWDNYHHVPEEYAGSGSSRPC